MSEALPLSGVMVIELGHSVAAPYAGEILGELGAEVIKIEKATGDDARSWAPPYLGSMSAVFQGLNRNKHSVVVDLRNPENVDSLKRFILESADVVIQNLRPGALSKFGLDGPALRAEKPDLIYCTIGAYGAKGPMKSLAGYDPLMQAFSGLMSVTGEPDHSPVRVGTSIIDMAAGMWSAIGVLSAVVRRQQTGEGAHIETSLYETALAWMAQHAAAYQANGKLPQRYGSGVGTIVPYRGYRSKDGFIVIAAGNDKLFGLLACVVGHPEWPSDPRFRTNPDRVENQVVLYETLRQIIQTRTTSQWAALLDEAGVPNAPMQTIDQVLAHPQTEALGILQPCPGAGYSLFGLPLSIDGIRPPFRHAPPELGADTELVLKRPSPTTRSHSGSQKL